MHDDLAESIASIFVSIILGLIVYGGFWWWTSNDPPNWQWRTSLDYRMIYGIERITSRVSDRDLERLMLLDNQYRAYRIDAALMALCRTDYSCIVGGMKDEKQRLARWKELPDPLREH